MRHATPVTTEALEHELHHVALAVVRRRRMGEDEELHGGKEDVALIRNEGSTKYTKGHENEVLTGSGFLSVD
jgi:hypothetical protein